MRHLALLLMFLLAVPALAQDAAPVPQSAAEVRLSYAPLVRQTAPSVVNIFTKKVVEQRLLLSPLFADPFFSRFFGPGLTQRGEETSLGSGVIVDPAGLVVTSYHVVAAADEITVVLNDRREFPARILRKDERSDLALLRLDAKGETFPALTLMNSDALQVGDLVLAIGNPFGVGQTVTGGIVSAVARTDVGVSDYSFFIQTDAAINPGNSGGALVAMDGRLAGVNSAIYSKDGGSLGIGFAVPANMVRSFISAQTSASGRVVRPWLGIASQPVTADLARALSLPRPAGVLVKQLHPASPGVRAGLRTGDVIVAVNGQAVDDPDALNFRIATLPVGARATLTINRRSDVRDVALELIAPPETPKAERTTLPADTPVLGGLTVANLSPALAEELSLNMNAQGVVVTEVGRMDARALGLQAGDILVAMNGVDIQDVRGLLAALRNATAQRRLDLTLQRGGRVMRLVFG